MADYRNLYQWEPGLEPEWVLEARKLKSAEIREYQRKARERQLNAIKEVCAACDIYGASVGNEAFRRLKEALKADGIDIGDIALKNRLAAIGIDTSLVSARTLGWPVSWPSMVSIPVERWLSSGYLVKGHPRYDYASMSDIADAVVSYVDKASGDDFACDYITARSMRMVLEAEGYGPYRTRDGRISLIGHKVLRKR